MPRLVRLHSFLDRFEERLEVDCEQLKRQLIAQIDERFGVIREKVTQLRNQINSGGMHRSARSAQVELCADPPLENVSLEQFIQERTVAAQSQQASTSTGRKRQSSSRSVNNKRRKTGTYGGSNVNQCKSLGCAKSFELEKDLVRHERIHLGIKPFSCTWPNCKYSAEQRSRVIRHIRSVHFKLPESVKKQIELNIEDDRDPNEFVRVDQQLANRRL